MTRRLLTAAVAVASVLAPGLPTTAAPTAAATARGNAFETCRGEVPTIVGTPDGEIAGTSGADVVLTNGATITRTFAGDDLVCVTGMADGTMVETGGGADLVDSTAALRGWIVDIKLGGGEDVAIGGAADERVRAAAAAADDSDRDVVRTAGGHDFVLLGGDAASKDVVRLGPESDSVWLQGDHPMGVVNGGPGHDRMTVFWRDPHSWVLDNRRMRLTADGEVIARWSSFLRFEPITNGKVRFLGGDAGEFLFLGLKAGETGEVSMGGGDDTLRLVGGAAGTRAAGGPGADTYLTSTRAVAGSYTLDLATGSLSEPAGAGSITKEVVGFENASLLGEVRITIWGTTGANRLRGRSEFSTVTLHGRAGDDVLQGGQHDDILIGGPGHDVANGAFGTDRCVAEVHKRCEG